MRVTKGEAAVFISFLSVMVLPSLFYVSLSASSMALGVLVSCIIIAILALEVRIPREITGHRVLFFAIIVFVYFALSSRHGEFSLKHILSFCLLVFTFFCAALFAARIRRVEAPRLINIIKLMSLIAAAIGAASIAFPMSFLNYGNYPKAVFPFSEPSHYVITISGMVLAAGFYLHNTIRVALLLGIFLFAFTFPSTLMLLLGLIMILSYYSGSLLRSALTLLFSACAIAVVAYSGLDVSYFEDRLSFGEETSNLTSLVYMQGWEDALRALSETGGLGLGFQNMGTLEPGIHGEKIFEIAGTYKNREDGGFLAAKIIGEFGVFGILFLLVYVSVLFKCYSTNRDFFRAYRSGKDIALRHFPPSLILGNCLLISFSIELFARGYGYFSPGVLLALVSTFLVSQGRCLRIVNPENRIEHCCSAEANPTGIDSRAVS